MNYNLDWLIENIEKGKRFKYLFFWGHQPSKDGSITASCFSQWWASSFRVNNIKYNTAEHWMMAQKALLFKDEKMFTKIIAAKSPAEAKKLGREVEKFNNDVWEKYRYKIVVQGNMHKFSQHTDLKKFLLNTKDRVLVEASPVDKIWGIGMAKDNEKIENPRYWKGLNLLGFALMEVRDSFIKNN